MPVITQERGAIRAQASAAPGGAGISLVSVTITQLDGPEAVHNGLLYLSDSPVGAGLTAVTASGVVVAGASGLIVGADVVAKKVWNIQTNATGLFILSITDAAKTPFVVVAEIAGRAVPLITLTAANYG